MTRGVSAQRQEWTMRGPWYWRRRINKAGRLVLTRHAAGRLIMPLPAGLKLAGAFSAGEAVNVVEAADQTGKLADEAA